MAQWRQGNNWWTSGSWWSANDNQWVQWQSGGGESPQWSGKGWQDGGGGGGGGKGKDGGGGKEAVEAAFGKGKGGGGGGKGKDGGGGKEAVEAAIGIGKGKREIILARAEAVEAAIGIGKGKGGGGGGGGNGDGKSSLGGKNSGRELLTSKGKTCRANWFKGKMGGPQTDAQKGRAKKSEWYRDQAAQGVGVSAQEEDPSDFQLEVPWPHSYKEMGSEFMTHWKTEAESRGFSLRLSAYRNRTWRDHPEQAAGFSRLVLTALDRTKMHRWDAVQILCDMAVASAQRPVPVNTLPWGDIIKWWDGEDPQRA